MTVPGRLTATLGAALAFAPALTLVIAIPSSVFLYQKTRREAVVPISRSCREALLGCRARSRESEYVFVDERTGRRYSLTRIRRVFALAKRLAGITRRFRPHDLRHTFASRLATRGVSLQLIAKALGHTGYQYSHNSADGWVDQDYLPTERRY